MFLFKSGLPLLACPYARDIWFNRLNSSPIGLVSLVLSPCGLESKMKKSSALIFLFGYFSIGRMSSFCELVNFGPHCLSKPAVAWEERTTRIKWTECRWKGGIPWVIQTFSRENSKCIHLMSGIYCIHLYVWFFCSTIPYPGGTFSAADYVHAVAASPPPLAHITNQHNPYTYIY